ncbi:basic proline-rich protein-like, partial [Mesocricetus auratus]|uniref:Basic proline-rich protein-like n=1 Tax=Mesocricetus auratus TaxID=10036 RepID=A0ABM2X2H0_MESAU
LFQEAEVRKEKADQGNELLIVTVLQNSTVPNSPPAEWKTPGPVLVPPPVPQDRSPRDPPFAGDPRRPPPLPPPPPGNIYAGPPAYFPPRDFIGPPFRSYPGQPRTDVALQRQDRFYSKSGRRSGRRKHTICKMPTLLEVDEPESSAEPSTENDNKSDPGNSTVPNTPAAECKTPGPGFIPPPVPQDRGPRGPPFAGDPRRPPPLMPHPAGNIYGSPPDFFPTRDFVGPPYPPYPGQPYCDNFLQRQDRFYSESGRLPGRRHHGNYNTPHLLESDEPELSAMPPSKSDNKSDRCNSTVPATPPAECKTPGPGFIPPPVPLDRGPRGPPFAWDPRRPPPFPPPPPGNIYEGRPDYFPPRDFPGPPFPPYP